METAQGNMMPVEALSGNLIVQTKFMDGNTVISDSYVKIFY